MFRHHARGLLLFVPIWNPQGEFGRGRAAGKMLAKGTAGYDGMTKRVPLPEAMRRQMDKMPLETAQPDRHGCDTATVKQLNTAFKQTTLAEWWPTSEDCALRWGIKANRLA